MNSKRKLGDDGSKHQTNHTGITVAYPHTSNLEHDGRLYLRNDNRILKSSIRNIGQLACMGKAKRLCLQEARILG